MPEVISAIIRRRSKRGGYFVQLEARIIPVRLMAGSDWHILVFYTLFWNLNEFQEVLRQLCYSVCSLCWKIIQQDVPFRLNTLFVLNSFCQDTHKISDSTGQKFCWALGLASLKVLVLASVIDTIRNTDAVSSSLILWLSRSSGQSPT